MTNLLARILLAMMLFPLAVTVYLVVLFPVMALTGYTRFGDTVSFLLTTGATALFVGIYWLRLWRHSVNWRAGRVRRTVLAAAGCVLAGVVVGTIMTWLTDINTPSFGIFIAGLVAMVSWLPITIVLWKETPLERANRLRQAATDVLFCPRCGYNMTGLYEARCPECGAQFTLNQLYAAQQKPEIADAAAPHEEHL